MEKIDEAIIKAIPAMAGCCLAYQIIYLDRRTNLLTSLTTSTLLYQRRKKNAVISQVVHLKQILNIIFSFLLQISYVLEEFDVEERPAAALMTRCQNVKVVHDTVIAVDSKSQQVTTQNGLKLTYKKLCIGTGGTPKLICKDNPLVLGIRDTESVAAFQKKLRGAKRVVIVGNGGIATELAYEIEGCEVVWAIKDASITNTFVDAGAAEFFLPQLVKDKVPAQGPLKRHKYEGWFLIQGVPENTLHLYRPQR